MIPVAALVGVNVVSRAARRKRPGTPGRTLLEALEGIEAGRTDLLKELRFPIQLVSRPDANFRGYAGTIASGEISVGDAVLALPSRKSSKVREITTADGPLEKAGTHQAVTIVLEDEIDLSRGDVLVHPDHRPTLARTFDANLIWMGEAPLLPGKRYEFKIGSRYVKGLVDSIQHRIDVNDLTTREAEALDLNGLARVRIALEEPVAVDDYKLSRAPPARSSSSTCCTSAPSAPAWSSRRTRRPAARAPTWCGSRRASPPRSAPTRRARSPRVVWFTGLSGSGKSTHRQCARTGAGAARPSQLPAGRRQHPPRPQQGSRFLRSRAQREHPPHRRGVGAVRGRRPHRDHRVHLAVPRGSQPASASASATRNSSRSICPLRSKSASAAIRRACT